MAQKGNLQTIRKKNRVELVLENTKTWITFYKVISNLGRAFFRKNVSLTKYYAGIDGSRLNLFLVLFYFTRKILYFKRKLSKKRGKRSVLERKKNNLSETFGKLFNIYNLNQYQVKALVINRYVRRNIVYFLFARFKRFRFNLFARRLHFFYDFLKITALFLTNRVELKFFIQLWTRLFQNISKRLHNKFVSFAKLAFSSFLKMPYSVTSVCRYRFLGAKFILSGRIRAKGRASSKLIKVGTFRPQAISKPTEYVSAHINTLYGIYGIKLWTLKEKKMKKKKKRIKGRKIFQQEGIIEKKISKVKKSWGRANNQELVEKVLEPLRKWKRNKRIIC